MDSIRNIRRTCASLAACIAIAVCCGCSTTGTSSARTATPSPQVAAAAPSAPAGPTPVTGAERAVTRGDADSATPVAAPPTTATRPGSGAAATPAVSAAPAGAPAPAALASYSVQTRLQGRLRSIGSDTMDELMQLWENDFRSYQPAVRFFHEGKGSSTAPPALIEGQCDFGPMSRAIKDSEIAQFKEHFGYAPTQVKSAIDALAVYVHPSNPIAQKGLTFAQLDGIFSSTRASGHADVVTWGQLGLSGEWANAPIKVFSRNSASGTYGFFKETVLGKDGAYKASNRELVGSAALVQAVAADRFAIGYSGIGYKTDGVASVPLAKAEGQPMFAAEGRYTYTGQYPLARFLYLTINRDPSQPASDLQREFLDYVFSAQGQAKVVEAGFFPLSPELAAQEKARVH